MKLGLRWKILLFTVLTPVTLAVAVLLMVNRDVVEHTDSSSLHESLGHSAALFEGMLGTRTHALEGGAMVVAQDPRFFSLLMLGLSQRDARFAATVRGMAHDFNGITRTDVFEVFDRQGKLVASAGDAHSTAAGREELLRRARAGQVARGVLTEPSAHFQAVAVPVHADGRVVGVLLLGAELGQTLALDLRQLMRCEVTFLSQGVVTGTTLRNQAERAALTQMLKRARLGPDQSPRRLGMLRMKVAGEGEYLTLVRPIPGSDPEAGQYYIMQRSFDPELLFQRTVRNDLLAVAAVALILAIGTSFVFSEQILRPVQKLVNGAREMEAGNYEHPIDVTRDDELGYLADQFTRMRSREQAYVSSLERATRLKSEFISIASHELRTPISVLSGYRDLLAEGSLGEMEPKQAKVVEAMREYLDRLKRVAEDATMIAEMRSERMTLDRRPSPLPGVVQLAVDAALAAAGGRNVRVETDVETPDAIVEVDSQALAQALTHLVSNGIRFTPDGGRVCVTASARDGLLSIAVSDTGVGMNEAVVASLHAHGAAERDAAHHRSAVGLEFNSGGLGLGYTLARGIVAAHGGQIDISSRQGEGSTFTVRIPVETTELRAAA